jgi:hypothetical protein
VTFLSPFSALVAAAMAVPLLLLLYFLKLRRQTLRIASTMLWQKSTEELQANTPFQRLRWSLLLLLQVLVVAALLGALARPVLQARETPSGRVILLIDRSGSMSARDAAGPSRLEAAKAAAKQTVQRLLRRREPAQIMVVAFASTAQVISAFESNRQVLLEAVDSVEPTDEQANLEAALTLAGAFASGDEAAGPQPPEVMLFSDGGVAGARNRPAAGFSLAAGDLRFIGVGPESSAAVDNVGIAALSARREYEDPARVLVFARLVNAGPQPVDTTATLRVDGEPVAVKKVRVPAAGDRGLGETPVTFGLELPRGAVLTLSSGHRDDLAADDTAALVVRPPAAPRIALIHPTGGPDPFLLGLVESLPRQRLVVRPQPSAEADGPGLPLAADEFDLVILDRVSPLRRPNVATLGFGAAFPGVSHRPPRRPGGQRVLSWDRQHPVMRHVSLDTLVFAGSGGYDLPAGSVPLAFGPEGPVIALLSTPEARHVLVAFQLLESNWPMHVSSTVFMQNALDFLTLSGAGEASAAFSPGRPITVSSLPEARHLSIQGPLNATVDVEPGSRATLPILRRVGLYTIDGAAPPMERIAVNMVSEVESDIRPRRSLVVNARRTEAGAAKAAAPLELWPWLAAGAIALLAMEWIIYCARMRG